LSCLRARAERPLLTRRPSPPFVSGSCAGLLPTPCWLPCAAHWQSCSKAAARCSCLAKAICSPYTPNSHRSHGHCRRSCCIIPCVLHAFRHTQIPRSQRHALDHGAVYQGPVPAAAAAQPAARVGHYRPLLADSEQLLPLALHDVHDVPQHVKKNEFRGGYQQRRRRRRRRRQQQQRIKKACTQTERNEKTPEKRLFAKSVGCKVKRAWKARARRRHRWS
jgi:hypothetical protein